MSGVLGLGLIAAAVLLYTSLFFVSRRAQPPKWAESVETIGVVTAVGLLVVGIAFTVRFAWSLATQPPGAFELVLTAAAAAGLFALCRFLRALWRRAVRRGTVVASAAELKPQPAIGIGIGVGVTMAGPHPANDPAAIDPSRPRPVAGGGRRRRAA